MNACNLFVAKQKDIGNDKSTNVFACVACHGGDKTICKYTTYNTETGEGSKIKKSVQKQLPPINDSFFTVFDKDYASLDSDRDYFEQLVTSIETIRSRFLSNWNELTLQEAKKSDSIGVLESYLLTMVATIQTKNKEIHEQIDELENYSTGKDIRHFMNTNVVPDSTAYQTKNMNNALVLAYIVILNSLLSKLLTIIRIPTNILTKDNQSCRLLESVIQAMHYRLWKKIDDDPKSQNYFTKSLPEFESLPILLSDKFVQIMNPNFRSFLGQFIPTRSERIPAVPLQNLDWLRNNNEPVVDDFSDFSWLTS